MIELFRWHDGTLSVDLIGSLVVLLVLGVAAWFLYVLYRLGKAL